MAGNIGNIPPDAVQVLFAEDLVQRILFRHSGAQYETWRAGPYRDFIFNAFSDEIRIAVDFIDMTMEWDIDEEFSKFIDNFDVTEKSFVDYALHHAQSYFHKGFVADSFLHYCVRLVSLSAYFAQYNVPQAPDLALFFILKVLDGRDMFEGGWDAVKTVAKKYVKLSEDFANRITPDISDDESSSSSSDEEQMDQSEENVFNGYFLNRDNLEANHLLAPEDGQVFKVDGLLSPAESVESGVIFGSESNADFNSEQTLKKPKSSNDQLLDDVEASKTAAASNEGLSMPITKPPASDGRMPQETPFKTNEE